MPNSLSIVPQVDSVRLTREGQRILVLRGGRVVLDMPADAAIEVGQHLIGLGRRAQQERPAEAERLALDSAILLRAGLGHIGLSNDPRILDMARTEAVSNRDLRRAMPGGVKSTTQCGAPAVVRHAPKRR